MEEIPMEILFSCKTIADFDKVGDRVLVRKHNRIHEGLKICNTAQIK